MPRGVYPRRRSDIPDFYFPQANVIEISKGHMVTQPFSHVWGKRMRRRRRR